METQIRTLAFGTCRIEEPLEILSKIGCTGHLKFPHHLHYPSQIFQTIKDYDSESYIPENLLYLISEGAIKDISSRNKTTENLAAERESFKNLSRKYDKFIIEVSGMHELIYKDEMYVEYFAKADILKFKEQLEPLYKDGEIQEIYPDDIFKRDVSDEHMIKVTGEICSYLDYKPILWVSHFDVLAPQKVRENRRRSISLLRKCAKINKNQFFDPTNVIMHLGQASALKDNGKDIAHFTKESVNILSEVYKSWIEQGSHAWIE
ncbi:hypothetical protein [Pseudomonas monteilii]|uniref:hypothetical protein n=1 Tax=Pseudomonas monteilii TaxID=76759 RepID=UPI0007612335|nr:hypothetical protein [Pseudomonas monteilii]